MIWRSVQVFSIQVPVTADQVAVELLLVRSWSRLVEVIDPVLMKSMSGGQATQVLTVPLTTQANHDPALRVGIVAVKVSVIGS